MSGEERVTTATVQQALSLSSGKQLWALTVVADRRHGANGLTKGKKVGQIVADTLPELLRNVATIVEHGDGTLDCAAEALREFKRGEVKA